MPGIKCPALLGMKSAAVGTRPEPGGERMRGWHLEAGLGLLPPRQARGRQDAAGYTAVNRGRRHACTDPNASPATQSSEVAHWSQLPREGRGGRREMAERCHHLGSGAQERTASTFIYKEVPETRGFSVLFHCWARLCSY